MLAHEPILVMATMQDERAAIRRDAHAFLWLSHWRVGHEARPAGTRVEDLEPRRIHGPGWTAVGGALPHDARSAEVRDDRGAWHQATVGHGAWVAFIPRGADPPGLPPVRYRDALRTRVSRATASMLAAARPLGERELDLLARLPHSTVGGECPVCGQRDWLAAPRPNGGAQAFCAGCGHSDGAAHAFYGARVTR